MARPKKAGDTVTTNIRITKEAHRWIKMLATMRGQDMSTALIEHLRVTAPEIEKALALGEKPQSVNEPVQQN